MKRRLNTKNNFSQRGGDIGKELKRKKGVSNGFTLVELIIVITILAILATIAFISFQSYSGNARDGNRISTVKNIETGLELYLIKTGTSPQPEGEVVEVMGSGTTASGTLLWTKGKIGENLSRQINMNKTPLDPYSGDSYIYAMTTKGEYQIATSLENIQANNLIPVTYANQSQAKVSGNYKSRFFETETMIYFVPSLIFTTEVEGEVRLFDTPAPTLYYVIDRESNLPYPLGPTVSENKEMKDLELVNDIIEKVKSEIDDETEKEKVEQYFTNSGILKTEEEDLIYKTIKETTGISVGNNQSSTPTSTLPTINGACGTANKIYEHTDTGYNTDTFCESGTSNPATPVFPTEGTPSTWSCEGSGSPVGTTANCTASKTATPINGLCGTANNKTYAHTETSFGSDTLCSSGSPDPSTPIFPTAGTSREWICVGGNGGSEASCSASTSSPPTSVSQTQCTSAGWAWISEANDVYIGNARGNGFCISPTIDIGDGTGQGIAWNGWGSVSSDASYSGWTIPASFADSDIGDGNRGQTRNLVNVVNNSTIYSCTAIGSATKGFRNASGQDDQDGQDTLENRMRYLSTYRTNSTKLSAINWISSNAKPAGHLVYPALYLSDCIDGTKDLGNDMTYTHSDNSTQNITYAQYSTQQSSTTGDGRSTEAYQNRQKYLLGWTQKKGSHLPSAYSYIDSGTAGGTTGNYKGEYEVACDLGSSGIFAGTNDQTSSERIWLASIGATHGSSWGHSARIVGYSGCASQPYTYAGNRRYDMSARFVVR